MYVDVKRDDSLPTEFVVKNNNFIEELRKLSFISVPCYLLFIYLLFIIYLLCIIYLLLWRLIASVRKALSVQVKISNVVSWSDSKVALYWVKSVTKKWKIWVENRVSEIRENVSVDCWCYVPTDCNSADVAYKI